MTYSIHVRAVAERDLTRARGWYITQAPHVVDRFEAEVDATFSRIVESPTLFPRVVLDARRAHLKVFPYEAWYRIHEGLQLIEVLAFVHDRQDLAQFTERM